MIDLLARLFIRNYQQLADPAVRRAYGSLCCILGICLNVLLFAGKYFAGLLSGSIAITADAFNNLSDAGSSLVTLLGFRLGGKKPDPEHPFGHGRLEYISGLVVSGLILLMGMELLRSSIQKIVDPQPIESSPLVLIILVVSVLVKVYMFIYNSRTGRRIDSAAMRATGMDSLSDCIATTVVLLAMLIARYTGLQVDGWAGILVSAFIVWAGFNAAKDTISPLLGSPPAQELIDRIEDIVMAHDEVSGIHDLVVHDYGPGRLMISLHAEVSGDGDIYELHDAIDSIEQELNRELGGETVIHMDPVAVDDEQVNSVRHELGSLLREQLDERVTIHDFRMVQGPTHTNLIFDAVLPYDVKLTDKEADQRIKELVSEKWPDRFCVLKIDHPYV
ncbi:MAG: cation transporter [Firmicutes bacterium]|nr:cation transporter [Bacillota bacterium]MBR0179493.1 cation transporter [Bacillota bacterium]